MRTCVIGLHFKFLVKVKICPRMASVWLQRPLEAPKWIKDPGNGLMSIRDIRGGPVGVHFMGSRSIWGPLFYVFTYQSEFSKASIYDLFLKARFIYHIVYQNHYKHLLESQLSTLVFNICHHTQLLLPRVIKLNIWLKNIQALLTTG